MREARLVMRHPVVLKQPVRDQMCDERALEGREGQGLSRMISAAVTRVPRVSGSSQTHSAGEDREEGRERDAARARP